MRTGRQQLHLLLLLLLLLFLLSSYQRESQHTHWERRRSRCERAATMTIISSGIACRETRDQTPHTHARTHREQEQYWVVRARARARASPRANLTLLTQNGFEQLVDRSADRSFVDCTIDTIDSTCCICYGCCCCCCSLACLLNQLKSCPRSFCRRAQTIVRQRRRRRRCRCRRRRRRGLWAQHIFMPIHIQSVFD